MSESELKVTDRRWWVKNEGEGESDDAVEPEEPRLKPTYVEELETRLAEKDTELQELLTKYRTASAEFDQARARLRKEVSKDVERSRRDTLIAFLEVLDNLDRALEAAGDSDDPVVQGVSLVRQQFLATLDGFGVTRIDPLGDVFDPDRHEAVSTVAASAEYPDGQVCGVVKPGYLIGDEILRPAMVAVARASE